MMNATPPDDAGVKTMGRALILSYSDCTHYLAAITYQPQGQSDQLEILTTAAGKFAKYPSVYRAQEALKALGYSHGWLVMHSAYDEMVGAEAAQKTELPMPFHHDHH